jgi:tetratricopeptide (TPR) repeat protein
VLVAVAAAMMGLPTLRGGFVGGDDHRLALNHVLVNHPSVSHALELFTIVHRDLYQPLPLLSFSAEFALAGALGLFETGEKGGAWLFHLSNIMLHTINAVLVWALIVALHPRADEERPSAVRSVRAATLGMRETGHARAVATVAALLFAVHPLQTEVIAWTNGRMMLMSTMFALASMLALARWLDRRGAGLAFLTVLFVLLSAVSKVRIGLPVLLLIVAASVGPWLSARHSRRIAPAGETKSGGRFLGLWLVCSIVTGVFVLVNVRATAGAELFSQGAEHLTGPRPVRILLALAWYFQHVVWPSGLASYYPAAPLVRWSDPATGWAALVLLAGLLILARACLRSRVARFGTVWFFATISSTLPFFPARNILAADRYMYLPIIGLFWLIAGLACSMYRRWTGTWSSVLRWAVPAVLAIALLPVLIGTGWHVASFYETSIDKTARIVELFPDTPRVWKKLGWCHYSKGNYTQAAKCAEKELRHDVPPVRSGAYQLMGMCELRLGNAERALGLLQQAIEVDPKSALARYRLALAYDELGRTGDALPHFEAAVETAPSHNPTLNRLASVYRRLDRPDDARAKYEQALANNPYEVPAAMGLAEIDIAAGTPESHRRAERRLESLLEWMPENADAWSNLGVVRQALGRTPDAIRAYRAALERNSNHVTAALNLGQIYLATGDTRRARTLFELCAGGGLASIDQAIVVHDFFVSQGEADRAVLVWKNLSDLSPDSLDARVFLAWSHALAGDLERAAADSLSLRGQATFPKSSLTPFYELPLLSATLAYIDLARRKYDAAAVRTDALCATGPDGADARRRLLSALERFDLEHPGVPWTFCLAARLLIAEGNLEGADLFVALCNERCAEPACHERVAHLRSQLESAATTHLDSTPGRP